MKEQLLKLIIEIDKENKYFGIIPMFPVFQKAQNILHIELDNFHKLLIELEKTNEIFLEPINDYNRLSFDEKKTVYYDSIRGYLYYIGFWS